MNISGLVEKIEGQLQHLRQQQSEVKIAFAKVLEQANTGAAGLTSQGAQPGLSASTVSESNSVSASGLPANSQAVNALLAQLNTLASASAPVTLPAASPVATASAAAAVAIPDSEQNVYDASQRSNYVYSSSKTGKDSTLWQLEDGLRRATDKFDYALRNAQNGYAAGTLTASGAPAYLTREQQIFSAKNELDQAQAKFDKYKNFLADPVARAQAEVAYQIAQGKPSENGPTLSAFDQFLVEQRRAGNFTNDGSLQQLFAQLNN